MMQNERPDPISFMRNVNLIYPRNKFHVKQQISGREVAELKHVKLILLSSNSHRKVLNVRAKSLDGLKYKGTIMLTTAILISSAGSK